MTFFINKCTLSVLVVTVQLGKTKERRCQMFIVDVMSGKPIYEQLIDQVEKFVLLGVLKEGDRMPSVRKLATELSINPNTIQKAYSELDSKGVIYSVPGRGCFVSDKAKDVLNKFKREKLSELESLVRELSMANVTRKELISCIDKVLKEGENEK